MDSREDCTRYLEVWLLNDPSEVLFAAQEAARRGPEQLERLVRQTLDDAPEGSSAWYTRRELSDGELDARIDWQEVTDTILSL
jgi:hypothetical protein